MKKIRKKGYVYVLDVVIAALLLLVGLALLFYGYPQKDYTPYFTDRLSEDIVGVLSETQITDLCDNPGQNIGCSCPNYPELRDIVCTNLLHDTDASLLSLFSETIERGYAGEDKMKAIIKEIFVDKGVIDEKRFGFSIIYTSPSITNPSELYNTENP